MQTLTPTRTEQRTESSSQSFSSGAEKETKATSIAGTAAQKASELAKEASCAVANTANQAATATGRGMEHLAEEIREHTPDRGMLGTASNKLADSLQSGGKYLERQGMDGLCSDLTGVVRSNPLASLAVAAGIGFLVARATSCRSA